MTKTNHNRTKYSTYLDQDLLRQVRIKFLSENKHKTFTKWLEATMREYVTEGDEKAIYS